jgi:hypothetical protein
MLARQALYPLEPHLQPQAQIVLWEILSAFNAQVIPV